MIEDGYLGIIKELVGANDYQVGSEISEAPNSFNGVEYHQPNVCSMACTIFGSIGALSDLTGVRFTYEQCQEMWDIAVSLGASPTNGWYISSAVDVVRNWWNSNNPDNEIYSVRALLFGEDGEALMDKGYSLVGGYSLYQNFNVDWKSDGRVDDKNHGSLLSGGHCIRIIKKDGKRIIVDNYNETPYRIDDEVWKNYKQSSWENWNVLGNRNKYQLKANANCMFGWGYAFIFKNNKVIKPMSNAKIVKTEDGQVGLYLPAMSPIALLSMCNNSGINCPITKDGGVDFDLIEYDGEKLKIY